MKFFQFGFSHFDIENAQNSLLCVIERKCYSVCVVCLYCHIFYKFSAANILFFHFFYNKIFPFVPKIWRCNYFSVTLQTMKLLFLNTIREKSGHELRTLSIHKTVFGRYVFEIKLRCYAPTNGCPWNQLQETFCKKLFYMNTSKSDFSNALCIIDGKFPEFEINDYFLQPF